jgi:SPP1 family predicted phage head-tail adaptor
VNAQLTGLAIGALTDRVSLQRRVDTSELEGGTSHAFMTVSSLWARVRTLSARLALAGDGRAAEASHSVVVRWRPDVSVGDRFGSRGRWLEVVGTSDLDGRRAWLSCQCMERGMAG